MKRRRLLVVVLCVLAGIHTTVRVREGRAAAHAVAARPARAWSQQAAATYLDGRMAWWLTWSGSQRDHGTQCVSCHTAVPYALARPGLRTALHERGTTAPEQQLLDNVVKRVRMWREVEPFYPDQTNGLPKSSESRGTEAVMNALILATRDAAGGTLTDDARQAFANLWALQFTRGNEKGSWAWLNFHYEPWESTGSPYFGAALAAIAVGTAPSAYATNPDIQPALGLLGDFLRRGVDTTHLLNRLMIAWASGRVPGIITPEQQRAIVELAFAKQHDDGGWSSASLGPWKRRDNTPLDEASDGYATGLAVLALRAAGIPDSNAQMSRALTWLGQHQEVASGRWPAWSLNKARDPASDIGKFMSDAATAYAVMALLPAR